MIGIKKSYTLQSKLWVPIELTKVKLKRWVNYISEYEQYQLTNNGYAILAENGEKIGVWYAFIGWKDWAAVRMIDEGVVSISAPINFGPSKRTSLR